MPAKIKRSCAGVRIDSSAAASARATKGSSAVRSGSAAWPTAIGQDAGSLGRCNPFFSPLGKIYPYFQLFNWRYRSRAQSSAIAYNLVGYLADGRYGRVHEYLPFKRVAGSAGVEGCDKASLPAENRPATATQAAAATIAIRGWL